MRECKKCQTKVSDDDLFCHHCGEKVGEKSVPVYEKKTGFCIDCGALIPESSAFCVECGKERPVSGKVEESVLEDAKVEQANRKQKDTTSQQVEVQRTEKTTTITSHGISEEVQSKPPEKRMSRWLKVLISLLLLIVVLAIGTYIYLNDYYDPMKALEQMDEAILSDDIDEFMKFVQTDEEILLDKKGYFAYIKEEWQDGLKDNYLTLIEEDKSTSGSVQKELLGRYGDAIFNVEYDEMLLGLFNGYTLQAVPVEVTALSNIKDADIKILDEKITLDKTDEEKSIGSFYPGMYEIEATATTEYGEVKEKMEFEIEPETSLMEVEFPIETFTIDVDSDFKDAILFIDGKSTGEKVSHFDELGPMPSNTRITIFAEWKDGEGKVHRSRVINLGQDQSSYIYLEFDERIALEEDSLKDGDINEQFEVAEFILDFRDSYENAVNNTDYSYIESYMKDGSKEDKDLKQFVNDMKKSDYYYDFKDNIVTNVKKKDKNHFEAKTSEQFRFYDSDGMIYDYDRVKTYYIEVIDGDYKINEVKYNTTKKKEVN